MRLGFAVKVLGRPGQKSNDARRWQNNPHLRVSLAYLNEVFDYLEEKYIRMYRISSDIAPYITHPDMPRFHNQIEECEEELASLGERARVMDIRLSMHPSQYIVLNSPKESVCEAAVRDFDYHARFLDAMGLGPEAVVVTHGGGVYGDKPAAIRRFVERYMDLPENIRRRVVLENDEKNYSVSDVLEVHRRTGIRLVFDNLHHSVLNPDNIPAGQAARRCLDTWSSEIVPKIHFSSRRTEGRILTRRDPRNGGKIQTTVKALEYQHADWINAEEFEAFVREVGDRDYDVMLEAKKKDLALLKLRDELRNRGIPAC